MYDIVVWLPQRKTDGTSISINVKLVSCHGNHTMLLNNARISSGLSFFHAFMTIFNFLTEMSEAGRQGGPQNLALSFLLPL